MKNKKTIYVLLPLAIVIWALIFIRIFSFTKSDDNYNITIPKKNIYSAPESINHNYKLILNYDDPFVKRLANKPKQKANTTGPLVKPIVAPTRKLPETKAPDIPKMTYQGIMVNKKSKRKIGLLVISSNSFMVEEGDVVEGVGVSHIHKDSITVVFNKSKIVIYK